MKHYLLGLDAGTTSFKGALFDESLALVCTDNYDYTLKTPGPDLVEFAPEDYFKALCSLTRSLVQKASISPEQIASLAISSQGETLICLDQTGQPIGDAIVWLDNRAEAQADELRSYFGRKATYEHTGQADMLATWPAAKLLWLKQNRPQQFAKTAKFLLLEDYLIYRLTGVFACEPNLYASSAIYDINACGWWDEMLQYLGVDEGRLPAVFPCGAKVGVITDEAARRTGLVSGTTVAAGALDQTCGAIGAGLTRPGSVMETTGSCLAVSANLDQFVPYDENHPLTCQNHAVPGRYVALLWSQTAGMVLKWFANTFCNAPDIGLGTAFAQIDQEAALVPPGCDGLLMLPHLSGASNPEYDPNARGVFYGITLQHGHGHFSRSILEAVSFMLRRNLEQVEQLGISFDDVYCMGGGSKSPIWCQIKADVTGKRFLPISTAETACRGAAMLAGVGAEIFKDIDSAAEGICKTSGLYLPEASNRPVYDIAYQNYIELYEALAPLFSKGKR